MTVYTESFPFNQALPSFVTMHGALTPTEVDFDWVNYDSGAGSAQSRIATDSVHGLNKGCAFSHGSDSLTGTRNVMQAAPVARAPCEFGATVYWTGVTLQHSGFGMFLNTPNNAATALSGYEARYRTDFNTVFMMRGGSQIGSANIGTELPATSQTNGSTNHFVIQNDGTNIKFLLDGVEKASIADTTLTDQHAGFDMIRDNATLANAILLVPEVEFSNDALGVLEKWTAAPPFADIPGASLVDERNRAFAQIAGTTGTANEVMLLALQAKGATSNNVNEALIQALQISLSSADTNLPGLMAAAAIQQGKSSWDQLLGSDIITLFG